MKSSLRTLLAAASLVMPSVAAMAQAPLKEVPVKILVVDLTTLLNEHPNTAEQNAKLNADQEAASAELENIQKQLNSLAELYKNQDEESKNPILNEQSRAKVAADAKDTYAKIQAKNAEGINYRDQFTAAMQKRIQNYRDLMFEEIGKKAAEIAKKKGATFLFDKSAIGAVGAPVVIFTDPANDITEEVLAEINRDRPAAPAPAPTAAPGATPSALKK